MTTGAAALLEPSLLARLESLQLGTRRRLAGRLSGEHRSVRQGASLDFVDERPYHPGDDYRRIDYALLARLDVLMVKLFEAEDDVHLRLLVDTSGSMATGGKLEQAARLAAALGFVALVRRDPVSVHTFPLDRPAPRLRGRAGVPALFGLLASLRAEGETDFAAAASHLLARPGASGVTVVLSDLLTPEWEEGLKRLPARGGDVVVVHVLSHDDLDPEVAGDVELVDRETGSRVPVSLAPDTVAAFRARAGRWADEVAQRCQHVGAGYVRVMATDDVEHVLLGAWRNAGVVR